MKFTRLPLCGMLLTLATSAYSAIPNFAESISQGDAHIIFRARYEGVDQDGFLDTANALSIKTRLNYKTLDYKGFNFFIELDDVSYLGNDDFNNTRNGQTNYPVIADPDGTDINQLYLSYKFDKTSVKFGRQRLNLDNQRFVGGVGWRQNEQTYDALNIHNTAIENVTIDYNYLAKINRIFGPDDGGATKYFDSNTHLLNANMKVGEKGKISAYGYFMDFENAAALSNQTIGVRYSNTYDFDSFKMPVNVEFAQQQEYGDNLTSYSASYYLLEAGFIFDKFRLVVGDEVLGGDTLAGKSFRTPLATLHKFQGWADKFLGTPAGGVNDIYFTVGTSIDKAKLALTFHDLSAETGTIDYGTETDISVSYSINKNYSFLFKLASYDADLLSTDTTKTWLMFTAKF